MAQNTLLEGLRSQLLVSIFGRRLGFAPGNAFQTEPEYLVGPRAFREQVAGVSSGSTIVSTAVATALPPYGVSLIGASGASATTAYILSAPVPGVKKMLFVPTTGYAVVITTTDTTGAGAGPMICSTASVTSTHQTITFAGKGNYCELIGLTTGLWGVLSFQLKESTGALSSAASTSINVTNTAAVTFA